MFVVAIRRPSVPLGGGFRGTDLMSMMTEGRHRWSAAATTNSLTVGTAQGLGICYLLFGPSGEVPPDSTPALVCA